MSKLVISLCLALVASVTCATILDEQVSDKENETRENCFVHIAQTYRDILSRYLADKTETGIVRLSQWREKGVTAFRKLITEVADGVLELSDDHLPCGKKYQAQLDQLNEKWSH